MDTKTGRIYGPPEVAKLPSKTLKELEPLTREEALMLAGLDPSKRVEALRIYRTKALPAC